MNPKKSGSYTLETLSFRDRRCFLKYLYTVLYWANICEHCFQAEFDEQSKSYVFWVVIYKSLIDMKFELTYQYFFFLVIFNTTETLKYMLLSLNVLDCFDQKESHILHYEEDGCTHFWSFVFSLICLC